MFTGIVTDLGEVTAVEPRGALGQEPAALRLAVRAPRLAGQLAPGDSLAVDGVCLTVVTATDGTVTADVVPETLARTSLGALAPGAVVNLEPALRLADRLDGHLVQGHVDGVGQILSRQGGTGFETVRISLPSGMARYVVEKGSVAVDGVSLTVVDVGEDDFSVSLIPTTLARTTLGRKGRGALVNIEVDVVAKYVEKLVRNRYA